MSKIKFLKTTTNYSNYILDFISKHPEMTVMKYDEALQLYFNDCNTRADFWKINLEATGKFECYEIIENADKILVNFYNSKRSKELLEIQKYKREIYLKHISTEGFFRTLSGYLNTHCKA